MSSSSKYEIPQSVLDETDCPSEFGCLTTGKCHHRPQCYADFTGSKNITFLKQGVSKDVLQDCSYVFASYNKLICRCPVRYYMCKKYGV